MLVSLEQPTTLRHTRTHTHAPVAGRRSPAPPSTSRPVAAEVPPLPPAAPPPADAAPRPGARSPARRAPGASRRVHGADAREALASFWTGSGGGTRIPWTCSAAGRTRRRGAHTSWSLRCARRNAALCGLCFDYRSSTGHGIAIAEASEAMLSVRAGCMGQSASHWSSSALDRAMPGA